MTNLRRNILIYLAGLFTISEVAFVVQSPSSIPNLGMTNPPVDVYTINAVHPLPWFTDKIQIGSKRRGIEQGGA